MVAIYLHRVISFSINKPMNKIFLLIIVFASQVAYPQSMNLNSEKLSAIRNIRTLAFGSCNKHYKKQPLWQEISSQSPDLFIWGGDSIYADGKGIGEILAAYKVQNLVEDYKLFKSQTPIIGIWDDHDFGKNNGGRDYSDKKLSQQYALDFLEEPINSIRRKQEGIYTSYDFGETGKRIKIILLDNRYFLDSKNKMILGTAQWEWLEKEIKDSTANLHFIVSGISVLTEATFHSEEWSDYPDEKKHLRKILKDSKRPYLYLTGDRHFASIFGKEGEMEFLSSGMTHNISPVLRPYLRGQYPNTVFEKNYGLIEINWSKSTPRLNLSVRTEKSEALNLKKIIWEENQWKEL
jgi:alkaline phosphatase D